MVNTYVTWPGDEYELSEADTIVSKHVGSVIIYKLTVIVLLLVILQNIFELVNGKYSFTEPDRRHITLATDSVVK